MAENVFARFAAPPGTDVADNPFSRFAPQSLPPSETGGLQGGIGPSYDEMGRKLMPVGPNGQAGGPAAGALPPIDFSQPVEKVRAEIAKLPEAQKAPALQAWADHFVAKEHADSPTTSAISDKVRQFTRGTLGLGSWLDEANAALPLGGGGGSDYAERKAYQDAQDRYADSNSTKLGHLPEINFGPLHLGGDVTTGSLAKLLGGALSMPFTPGLNAGVSTGGQIVKQGLAGIGYGAAHGAGEGSTTGERIGNAGTGALVGGLLGAAAPPVANGASSLFNATARTLTPLPRELRGMSRDAVEGTARAFRSDQVPVVGGVPLKTLHGRDDGLFAHGLDLGHQGTLADLGPALESRAMGLAASSGEHQPILNTAYEARKGSATQRITHDFDATMGPPQNVPQVLRDTAQATAHQVAPLYRQLHQTQIQPTAALNNILTDIQPKFFAKARALAHDEGHRGQFRLTPYDDAMTPLTGVQQMHAQRVPTTLELDYLKRALDDGVRSETDSITRNVSQQGRAWANQARALRTEVDNILSPGAPEQSIWAQARGIHSDQQQLREAVDMGRSVLKRNISPDEVVQELQTLGTPAAADAYRMGVRQGVRDAMGKARTRFGPNADTGAAQLIGSQYARENLHLLLGRDAAERVIARMEAEGAFEATRQSVLKGSMTSRREGAKDEFKLSRDAKAPHHTLYGDALSAASKIGDALMEGAVTARKTREMTDSARMLVAQGADRNAIVRGLQRYLNRQGISNQARTAIRMVISGVIHGAKSSAIGR